MPHVSRLSRHIRQRQLVQGIDQSRAGEQPVPWTGGTVMTANWLLEAHLRELHYRGEPQSCIVCGCTEENACALGEVSDEDCEPVTCSWVAPGLCSNPVCVEQFEGMVVQL